MRLSRNRGMDWGWLWLVVVLAAAAFPANALHDPLGPPRICELRCIAACVANQTLTLDQCRSRCSLYANPALCSDVEVECWETCKGLSESAPNRVVPNGIDAVFMPTSALNVTWASDLAPLFLIQHSRNYSFDDYDEIVTTDPQLVNWRRKDDAFCSPLYMRIASVTPNGVSDFSRIANISAPSPQLSAGLDFVSMEYIDKPYTESGYYSNGTVRLTLKYGNTEWPLGLDDLTVEPLFHMINCMIPDLSTAIPSPQFTKGPTPQTVVSEFGADLMYRKCQFLYYVMAVKSALCKTTSSNFGMAGPDSGMMKTLLIECSNVERSPCPAAPIRYPAPLCGQIEAFAYDVLNKNVNANDRSTNITANVTFRSTIAPTRTPLYFEAFYGNAQNFDREIDVDLLGVDMLDILGNATNCPEFNPNGTCALELNPVNSSVVITGLHMDTLYGVMICAVMDARNLTFPPVSNVSQNYKSRANKVYIDSKQYEKSKTGMIIGIVAGCVAAVFLVLVVAFVYFHRKQRDKMRMHQFKLEQLKLENEQRYTDFPRKQDIWELERRNLIIYEDKKLGSGAFGAVYMGRLIGVAKGHKDAQSTLGVNLMRAENCDVAVKMLPEYADEISKSEFLREIALMKTLGYHERLVNMLACITESEPLCLVVEYCSDGDLLHFLRERCKYMLKLTDIGVDYDNPTNETEFDVSMIITLKQLLMFAVQISYGLEYLSQKGFVHRDVAARNVLVHEGSNAKIGDFGLCRYIYAESANYKGKGGRLPVKWMSPEAIKHYEFTTKSDVWSFGILMFEVITLGGSPYPGIQPDDMMEHLEAGGRMEQPDNCPDNFYEMMRGCWEHDPALRPDFGVIRQKLAAQLEEVTDEYSYLKLDSQRDYYNVTYGETHKEVTIPAEKEVSDTKDAFEDVRLSPLGDVPTTLGNRFSETSSEQFLVTPHSAHRAVFEFPSLSLSSTSDATGIVNAGFTD